MITCKQVTDAASTYLDEPRSLPGRLAFQLHLVLCHRCRRFVRQLKIAVGASQTLNAPTTPDEDAIEATLSRIKSPPEA